MGAVVTINNERNRMISDKLTPEQRQILFKHGPKLALFTSMQQMSTITDLCFGEEGQFFLDKMKEYGERIESMPKTYEQDGKGDEAIAYLHYFIGGCDWYITEKDKGSPDDEKPGQQSQAFGMVRLHPGNEWELGYISIEEVTSYGAELDLHFTPCTLAELKQKDEAKAETDEEVTYSELSQEDLQALVGKEVAN